MYCENSRCDLWNRSEAWRINKINLKYADELKIYKCWKIAIIVFIGFKH